MNKDYCKQKQTQKRTGRTQNKPTGDKTQVGKSHTGETHEVSTVGVANRKNETQAISK